MPSRSPRFASTIRKLEDLPSDGGAAVDVLDGANLRIFVRLHELEFALARVTSRRAALERPRRQHACGGSAAVLHRGKVAVMTPLVVGLVRTNYPPNACEYLNDFSNKASNPFPLPICIHISARRIGMDDGGCFCRSPRRIGALP
jgi:hypothetical protein